jgi:hypothetical protein
MCFLQCYYRDDRVGRSLGLEPMPPYPRDHVLEDGDRSLLDLSERVRPCGAARSLRGRSVIPESQGSQLTRRRREMDSNPRSPGYGGALCFWARATRPTYRPPGCPLGARGRSFKWQTEIIWLEGSASRSAPCLTQVGGNGRAISYHEPADKPDMRGSSSSCRLAARRSDSTIPSRSERSRRA